MWEDNRYFWVVLCKYRWVHIRASGSIFFRYRIALGETDAVTPCPVIGDSFLARCDKCGQEASYRASDLFRFELDERPEAFTPHPLFREGGSIAHAAVAHKSRDDAGRTDRAGAGWMEQMVNPAARRSGFERIRSKVATYLRGRHKKSPPPYWRRPPQEK